MQFRSERHPECLPCLGKIRKNDPLMNTALGRNDYAKKCKDDETFYNSHMDGLAAYEEMNINRDKPRGKLMNKLGGENGMEVDVPTAKVQMVSESGLEMKKFLGIMWPEAVFEAKEGRKPSPEEMTSVDINKVKYTGVLRERDHGCPRGCWEVFETVSAVAQHECTLADSAEATSLNEVDDTWKRLRKCTETNVTSAQHEDGSTYLKATPAMKKVKDDFDDLMDWGFTMTTASKKGGGGGGSSSGGAGSVAGSGGSRSAAGGSAAPRSRGQFWCMCVCVCACRVL